MNIIDWVTLSQKCDYNFGGHGNLGNEANKDNKTFHNFISSRIENGIELTTVFIDNIRLYSRHIEALPNTIGFDTQGYLDNLARSNDLLQLVEGYPDMKFKIFSSDDSPIDEHIFGRIPRNVVSISAVNALWHQHKKIKPIYLGVSPNWGRNNPKDLLNIEITSSGSENSEPHNLLYVNFNEHTNLKERTGIKQKFLAKHWATVEPKNVSLMEYYRKIKEHKFVLCPPGNGLDTHRIYEVLCMKRVPVVLYHTYMLDLLEGLPVVFVNDWNDITKELLEGCYENYHEAGRLDLSILDVDNVMKI